LTAPTLSLHREHHLDLPAAREVARHWAAKAEQKLGMACRYEEGPDHDTLHFSRTGLEGQLRVDAKCFELQAQLSGMMAAFKGAIETEIVRQLDRLIAGRADTPHTGA